MKVSMKIMQVLIKLQSKDHLKVHVIKWLYKKKIYQVKILIHLVYLKHQEHQRFQIDEKIYPKKRKIIIVIHKDKFMMRRINKSKENQKPEK